jgi:hypothetical protein
MPCAETSTPGTPANARRWLKSFPDHFLELEESDVPANYVVRLRQEQAGLRKGEPPRSGV